VSINSFISDGDGSGIKAHVHPFSTAARKDHVGLLALTERLTKFNPELQLFSNDDFGTAMNQNVSFSGTPEIIHNGGTSTEWTGTAISGTWNFADSDKITITSADNNDQASFAEEGATTIDMNGFTALTGKIDLDIYNAANNSITIEFDNAGVVAGNSINLNDFIDTGNFSEQSFAIPKAQFGLSTQLLDGMTITINRIGGTKPTMKFDDIQFEQTGTPAVFTAITTAGERFHATGLRVVLADNITGITTVAGATETTAVPNLSYDALLGVSALTNGIVFQIVRDGEVSLAVNLKQIGDFLTTGGTIVNHISDGTNTFISLVFEFVEPIVIIGDGGDSNFMSLTINDNLSGLLEFRAVARGSIEI